MIRAKVILIFTFIGFFSSLNAQNLVKMLTEKKWSAYENFAVFDFNEDGKAFVEYAYCTYCQGNLDTLNWSISDLGESDKILTLGEDSLIVTSFTKNTISTFQYGIDFDFKAIDKIEAGSLKKEDLTPFLVSGMPLEIKIKGEKFESHGRKIQFNTNGTLWIEQPAFRGQWIIKYFYGDVFLVYLNRFSANRDFPALKIISFKNDKLVGLPVPTLKQGSPVVLEIYKK